MRLMGRRSGLAALFALWCLASPGRESPDFRSSTDLVSLGLRIRLPSGAVEDPLPPLQRQTYQFRQGTREWTETGFHPRDIWYRTQHAGQWRDPRGNLLILARILHPLPVGFDKPHVTREEYDARMDATEVDLSDAEFDALLGWARDFLGVEPGAAEALRFQAFRLRAAAFVPTDDPRRLLYIFRVQVRQVGERTPRPRSFAAELRLVPGADPARARQRFEEGFLRTIDTLAPPAAARPDRGAGDAATAEDDDAMRRSREDARDSIANLGDWWHADTPNYIILSNQRRGAGHLIRDLERDLEPMLEAYRAFVPPLRDIRTVSIIRIFASAEEYAQYVGPNYAWSGGIWDESRGELVIRPVQAARYPDERAAVMRTVYHEAFHQYLTYATTPLRACAWFNEGHATFFEHASLRQQRVVFNEFEPFARQAGGMPLSALFALDYPGFYGGNDARRRQHYATAWALTYYLRRAAAAERDFPFAAFLGDYLTALEGEGDGPRATRALLARYDREALERDYRNFWDSPRRRRFAARAPALP